MTPASQLTVNNSSRLSHWRYYSIYPLTSPLRYPQTWGQEDRWQELFHTVKITAAQYEKQLTELYPDRREDGVLSIKLDVLRSCPVPLPMDLHIPLTLMMSKLKLKTMNLKKRAMISMLKLKTMTLRKRVMVSMLDFAPSSQSQSTFWIYPVWDFRPRRSACRYHFLSAKNTNSSLKSWRAYRGMAVVLSLAVNQAQVGSCLSSHAKSHPNPRHDWLLAPSIDRVYD